MTQPLTASAIPEELRALPQWVCWRIEQRSGKPTKVPKNPHTGRNADSTDASTWSDYEAALASMAHYHFTGIGFVFSKGDPYTGIDLDHCVNLATGEITPWAQSLIDRFDTYTELSQSHTGAHMICKGQLPGQGRNKRYTDGSGIEMYSLARFFTVTGEPFPGAPLTIEERQAILLQVEAEIWPIPPASKPMPQVPSSLSDHALLAKMFAAKNGPAIQRLWNGEIDTYGSQSEADLALCSHLAFWTGGDAERIDTLFRASGLYRSSKWDRDTYRIPTIEKSLAQPRYYEPTAFPSRGDLSASPLAISSPETRPLPTPYGDVFNAEALCQQFGATLRYCPQWKGWQRWAGTHWHADEHQAVMEDARQTMRDMLKGAADSDTIPLQKHATRTLASGAKLRAMIDQASSLPAFAVTPAHFDADTWLLNCQNGTLDLRTGVCRPHDQTDYITRCLSIPYDATALCPTWDTFLWRIMGGQDNGARAKRLMTFLQRAVGYALTGSTQEDVLFLLHGSGRNGKSRFLDACHHMLAGYAKTAQMTSFLHQERDTVRNDLADLHGVRFVSAIETTEGKRLSEGMIKQLTGGDRIKARFLFQEYFEFLPQFKIFLALNHRPEIRETENAIWERIRLIPFEVYIPPEERDKHLSEKLCAELPGILAWAVRGCLDWQREGLSEPEEVTEATTAYRREQDQIGRFLEERCYVDKGHSSVRVKSRDLYGAYKAWCDEMGEHEKTQNAFGRYLTTQGFPVEPGTDNVKWRVYIGLLATTEPQVLRPRQGTEV